MLKERTGRSLPPSEVLGTWPEQLSMPPGKTREFYEIAGALDDCKQVAGVTQTLKDLELAMWQNEAEAAQIKVDDATLALETAKLEIAPSGQDLYPNRLQLVNGRTRVAMNNPDFRPPLWFKVAWVMGLKKFVGGGPLQIHPKLVPFEEIVRQTGEELEQTVADIGTRFQVIGQEYDILQREDEKELNDSERGLLNLCLQSVVGFRSRAVWLLQQFPNETQDVARRYATLAFRSRDELVNFLEFLEATSQFKWDSLPQRQRANWQGKRREWAAGEELRCPTPEELDQLPQNVVELWKGYIARRILSETEDQ